jgi:hypothetical protein
MNFAEISGTTVLRVTSGTTQEFIDTLPNPADWVECPWGVSAGWNYDGANFTDANGDGPTPEPPPKIKYRTLLTGPEWVSTFTDAEWQFIKTHRSDGTPAGDNLDRMMDAIRWTNSIDVASPNIDEFYTWLLNNGLPGGQARIDELRQGILE